MGLSRPVLRLIAREHKRKPFSGSVLTLGRQKIYATIEEVYAFLKTDRIVPVTLDKSMDVFTNIPAWQGTTYQRNTSDIVFFNLLGLKEVKAMDYSDYEGADIIHDLNCPVPKYLHNRFDLIIDGGTTEHVFDVRQSWSNIGRMLKPGGRVIHTIPVNNWVNHGFFQFSPTLFFDYYSANKFVDLQAFLLDLDRYFLENRSVVDVFEISGDSRFMMSNRLLMLLFVAEKSVQSTENQVPIQSMYQQLYHSGEINRSLKSLLVRFLPVQTKILIQKIIPGVSTSKKPWRLKRIARLR